MRCFTLICSLHTNHSNQHTFGSMRSAIQQWPLTCLELFLLHWLAHMKTHWIVQTNARIQTLPFQHRLLLVVFFLTLGIKKKHWKTNGVLAAWCITLLSVEREPSMWTVWGPLLQSCKQHIFRIKQLKKTCSNKFFHYIALHKVSNCFFLYSLHVLEFQ